MPEKLPEHVDLDSGSVVDTQALTFLDDRVDAWSGRVDSPWQKVTAMAKALQSGAYTDGGAAGDAVQNVFLPGHSLRRMTQFMKATQLAGNDEQYASALALATNRLGVPARVVLGAVPDATGAVKGKDVHAWVEIRRADGEWQAIMPSQFLPDRNKKPEPLIQKSEQQKTGAQVPPPAANNPPSVLQGPDQAQNATQLRTPPKDEDSPLDPDTWPDWLRYLVFFVAIPLLLVLLVHGGIRLAKAVRRRRRRRAGGPSARVTGGWREVVDTARDLRMPLPVKGTRLEQARALEVHLSGPPPAKPSPIVDGAVIGAPIPVSRAARSAHSTNGVPTSRSMCSTRRHLLHTRPMGGRPSRRVCTPRRQRSGWSHSPLRPMTTSSTSQSRRARRSTPSGPTWPPRAGHCAPSTASGSGSAPTCPSRPSARTCRRGTAWDPAASGRPGRTATSSAAYGQIV